MNFIPVEISGHLYGLEVSQVREIMNTPPITPVPLAPHWIVGLANVRGDLVSLVSVPERLGHPHDPQTLLTAPQIVVLHLPPRTVVGIPVHRVGPVRNIGDDQLTPGQHVCERGRVMAEGVSVGILDPDQLIRTSEVQ